MISFILLLIFSFILIKAADLVIYSLKRISRRTRTGIFTLSVIIMALGTSLPELFVGVTSALEGVSNLTLGIVIGSNIANISLVVGTAALISGRVKVSSIYLKRDVAIALVAGISPVLLVLDGRLSEVDGLVLLAIYGVYASSLFTARFKQIATETPDEDIFHRLLRRVPHLNTHETKEYTRLFIGVALLLLSADVIVKVAQSLAITFNIPVFVIGLVVLAIGTSLPELAFSLRSLEDHTPSMFFGNLLGSTIINSTLVIGVAAVINPVEVAAVNEYLIATTAFVVIFILFWLFIRSKHRLDRWEAAVLVALYVVFVIIEFL